MRIALFIATSFLFGWAFTEYYKRNVEKALSQLIEERRLRKLDQEEYERNLNILKATIRELL